MSSLFPHSPTSPSFLSIPLSLSPFLNPSLLTPSFFPTPTHRTIYQSILMGHITSGGFPQQVQKNAERIANVALDLHQKVYATYAFKINLA